MVNSSSTFVDFHWRGVLLTVTFDIRFITPVGPGNATFNAGRTRNRALHGANQRIVKDEGGLRLRIAVF